MATPPRLEIELQEVGKTLALETVEDNDYINVVFKAFPLGSDFNVPSSELLLRVPKAYPEAGPDMFWTKPEVTFADGRIPQAAESLEDILGRQWRRFSWHRQATWNPTIDNLHSHIEFINARLRKNE